MSYERARSLADLQAALAKPGGAVVIFGGGSDLMVRSRGEVRDGRVLDVSAVPELRRIVVEGSELVLGAGVTFAECLVNVVIRRTCPLLAQVAERFASPQIRNVATLGGNVANASPAADGTAALWALDAVVEAITHDGVVTRPVAEVVQGPGRLGLESGSVLAAFRVPARVAREGTGFYKLVNRAWPEHPMAISVASLAVRLRLDGEGRVALARVVLGAVAPTPIRAEAAERILLDQVPDAELMGRAAAAVAEVARPITDVRASAAYRREVLPALTTRALEAALDMARAGTSP